MPLLVAIFDVLVKSIVGRSLKMLVITESEVLLNTPDTTTVSLDAAAPLSEPKTSLLLETRFRFVRHQQNSDTVELGIKVWFEGLGESVTPEGVTEKLWRKSPTSRIDGLHNWASISPKESREHATTERTEPNYRRH